MNEISSKVLVNRKRKATIKVLGIFKVDLKETTVTSVSQKIPEYIDGVIISTPDDIVEDASLDTYGDEDDC